MKDIPNINEALTFKEAIEIIKEEEKKLKRRIKKITKNKSTY